jgi:hypothetical protein
MFRLEQLPEGVAADKTIPALARDQFSILGND